MPRTLTAADRSALIRLAATMDKGSPERKAILAGLEKSASLLMKEWEAGQEPLFKAGSSKEEKYVQLFRDLADKRRKTIQVDLKGVMGGSTNGLREFKRGRMGRPKRWRGGRKGPFERVSLSIVPLDDQGNPIKMRSGYKLWLSEYDDGTADVSASIGDMAIMINDMKA